MKRAFITEVREGDGAYRVRAYSAVHQEGHDT